jgi:SMC interacting uncharacterized protein involved in chromosome segregation
MYTREKQAIHELLVENQLLKSKVSSLTRQVDDEKLINTNTVNMFRSEISKLQKEIIKLKLNNE